MAIMSISDYAQANGVSYEAARKLVRRYTDELGEHLLRQGQTRYLDDEGQKILDTHRQGNPISVITTDRLEEIQQLRAEVSQLKDALLQTQGALMAAKDKLIASAGQQALLDAATHDKELLQAQIAATAAETARKEAELNSEIRDLSAAKAALEARNAALEAELAEARRPWWQKFIAKK